MSERRPRWTLLQVLDWTRGHFEEKGVESPRLDAEVLLAHVLDTERVMLYARFDQPMSPAELTEMRRLVAARAAGTPVAHLTGKREFWSLVLEVTPSVLIPRPETEIMIEVARRRRPDARRVVDVGTGSGAALLALLSELPQARGWGLELSSAAAEVARRNLRRANFDDRAEIHEGHLLEPLPLDARPADLVVANLPYIPSEAIAGLELQVRHHEPRLALDGGPDGLVLIRELIGTAAGVLEPGGVIALESGHDQCAAVAAALVGGGFEAIEIARDLAGLERITSGRRPARR